MMHFLASKPITDWLAEIHDDYLYKGKKLNYSEILRMLECIEVTMNL